MKSVKVMIVSSSDRTSAEVSLSLYVWETSTQSKISAADTSNYRYIADISVGQTVIEILPFNGPGLYLGIRDNGTCVTVSRVLVYYSVCEAGRQGLVRVEGNSSAGDTLPGTCVENSVSTSGSGPPLLQCLESGQWRVSCPQGNTRCRGVYGMQPVIMFGLVRLPYIANFIHVTIHYSNYYYVILEPCECRPGYQQQRMNEEMVCSGMLISCI